MKLGKELTALIPQLKLHRIYEVWYNWKRGVRHPQLGTNSLACDVHGVTHIRNGRVTGVEITDADDLKRQLLTVVHELIHVFAHPSRPDHRDIHTLAAGLAHVIFPKAERLESVGDLFDDELAILTDLSDGEELDLSDESVVLTDGEDYDLLRKKKNILNRLKKFMPHQAMSKLLRGRKAKVRHPAGIAAPILAKKHGGWIMGYLAEGYRTGAFVVPRRGVTRCTPLHNTRDYDAQDYDSMFDQGWASLNAGDSRTIKGIGQALFGVGPTTVVLAPLVRSLGLIVKFSDSILANINSSAIIVLFPASPNPLRYKIDLEPTKGTSEIVCFFVENDRGKGVLTARNDQSITVEAGSLAPTTQITIESINIREIVG